jgi:hypothetical protein
LFFVEGLRESPTPAVYGNYEAGQQPSAYNATPAAAQYQYQQPMPYQPVHNPSAVDNKPAAGVTATPTNPSIGAYQAPQQAPYQQQYDRLNRIDVIRRICGLQHADGHWTYSVELAELVKQWGGRDLMTADHDVTAMSHACLLELCSVVWTAQRDNTWQTQFTPAELTALQVVNWDLSWAKAALDRATAWMTGFR